MNPLMIDVPEEVVTPRLILRIPAHGDGRMVNRAIRATLSDLKPWFAWMQKSPRVRDTELYLRQVRVAFYQRKELNYLLFDRLSGEFAGSVNVFNIYWKLGRFEFGYWCARAHQGQGYVREAVAHLMGYLQSEHAGRRFVIACQEGNQKSANVALRLGFEFEGVARQSRPGAEGTPVDMRIYAKIYQ